MPVLSADCRFGKTVPPAACTEIAFCGSRGLQDPEWQIQSARSSGFRELLEAGK
ncbi:hypothetical protein JOE62_000154 [Glutamicibacter nicotianae]|nr:hypothetical protein [Glutamicibacter nicotianae]